MATEAKRPRGRPALGVEHHKAAGTYRRHEHGTSLRDMSALDFAKPKHLDAPERERLEKENPAQLSPPWPLSKADELARENKCWFDMRFVAHFEEFGRRYLRHWEGRWAGQPFELMDWQRRDVFGPLFGWFTFDEELGRPVRRHNRAYIEVPKKNGKSPMGAYLGAYMLCADGEGGAKVFSAATAKEQAAIVHNHARLMIQNAPDLEERTKVNRTTKNIYYAPTESNYTVISSDVGRQEGLNGNACIIDELHVWRGRDLWDALKYMGASRDEPILFAITTAGDDMQSVCREQHDYASRVLDGSIVDQGFLGYIAAADDDDDPGDPEVWAKANPSLGETVRLKELEQSYNESKDSPNLLASFKRYRLNIWKTAEAPWLRYDRWLTCGELYEPDDLIGLPCFGGLDLAKTRDMTAFVLVFVKEGRFYLVPYFWLPEETANDKSMPADYRAWTQHGMLQTTPGDTVDYSIVKDCVCELIQKYSVVRYAFDPWNAEATTQAITDTTDCERVAFRQTIGSYAHPTANFERLVLNGDLAHPNNEILNWQAQHVTVWNDMNGNMRPVKPLHGDHRKIDGIVASIMGLSMAQQAEEEGSIYDDRGPVMI